MPLRCLVRVVETSVIVSSALIIASGCERHKPVAVEDSASAQPQSTGVQVVPSSNESGWDSLAGPVLLVQGETRDEAIVLLPAIGDTVAMAQLTALGSARANIRLFGRGGEHLTARLGPSSGASNVECRVWTLREVHADGAADLWAVGFAGGQTASLALDSVDLLGTRDSMALAAEAARLASAVTAPTDPSFQGLRFTAHDIRRFEASPGVQAIVAHLIRKVNQEASPLQEQTLLIAERDSGTTSGPYQLAYAERTHGLEEAVTMSEVIAGVQIAGRPTLIVARDGDAGISYAMLERNGPRRWRVRWTSAMTHCG
jgi:hypothetical protein